MFIEYKGYFITQDAFGYYEVWDKSANWLIQGLMGKKKAKEFIDKLNERDRGSHYEDYEEGYEEM